MKEPKSKFNKPTAFDFINIIFLSVLAIIMIFPLYYTVIVSFATPHALLTSDLYILPTSFTLDTYRFIFEGGRQILNAFFVSVFITFVGVGISMFLSTILAYAISKPKVPFTKAVNIFVIITLFFNAGLIPYYLTVMRVGLIDSIWVMIIPMAINAFFIVLLRNYFQSLPISLEESARIDGANDLQILFRIILPLSKPILATIALFYAVERWNEWWHAMLFVSNRDIMPLQLVLRQMLINVVSTPGLGSALRQAHAPIYTRSLQMAVVVVAMVPIMSLYPFAQKYFSKGIMLGAVKG